MAKSKHPGLTKVVSVSSVFSDWIYNSKVETTLRQIGLEKTKDLIISDLQNIVGKGLSEEKFEHYKTTINNQLSNKKLMLFLSSTMLQGANMGVI
jgi:hypothetical protein